MHTIGSHWISVLCCLPHHRGFSISYNIRFSVPPAATWRTSAPGGLTALTTSTATGGRAGARSVPHDKQREDDAHNSRDEIETPPPHPSRSPSTPAELRSRASSACSVLASTTSCHGWCDSVCSCPQFFIIEYMDLAKQVHLTSVVERNVAAESSI